MPYAAWLYSDGSGARRITVRRFSSSTNAWQPLGSDVVSSDVFLPPGTGIGPALSLTVGRDNLPIVAWEPGRRHRQRSLRAQVRRARSPAGAEPGSGSASGGGVSANAGFSRFPALAVDTHNNLNTPIVAWLDNSSGLPQIYVRRAVSNADLVVESVTAASAGAAGQAVDVSAVVRNRGPVAAGAFGVGLFLSTNNTIDPASDRLLTTQQVSGLRAGAQAIVAAHVTLPANVAPGAYFFGAFADIGQVIDEIDEANDGLVGPNGIQIVGPDLVVTALNGPFTATPGQMLAVEVTVKNQAAPPGAAAASRVGVYLTQDPLLAPRWVRAWAWTRSATLAAGASQTLTSQLVVPANLTPGTYTLAAFADDDSQVAESDEGNNNFNAERRIDIVRGRHRGHAGHGAGGERGRADLHRVRPTSRTRPRRRRPRRSAVASCRRCSPPWPAPPGRSGSTSTCRQTARSTPTARRRFWADATSTGSPPAFHPRACVHHADGAGRRGRRNVRRGRRRRRRGRGAGAERDQQRPGGVEPDGHSPAGSDRHRGERTGLADGRRRPAARGDGEGEEPGARARQRRTVPRGLLPLAVRHARSGRFRGLRGGPRPRRRRHPATLSATVTVPAALLDGTYFLSAIADYDNRVVESTEGNNKLTASAQIAIARPDLVVANVAGPASGLGAAGQPLGVTFSVKNQASAPANAGAFKVGFYLSTVNAAGAGTCIGSASVSGVAAGATAVGSATVVVPTSVAANTYFLSAVADFEDRVAEGSDGNNGLVAANQITIRRPDLVITKVAGPASGIGAAGQPLAVTLGVKNLAPPPANAGPFKVGLYLSPTPNTTLPVTGTLIGSLNVSGAVASALPLTVSGTVSVPASIGEGTYYLSAVADVDGVIPESTTANNVLTADGQIVIGRPDLSVTRVAGPVSGVGATGQPLTVSADIKNEGPALANAGPFRVAFFLSATDAAPGAGTLLGSVNVPALAAGARITLSPKFTVPASLAADDYFLSVIADADQVIVESDEANNGLAVAPDAKITIRRPNLAVLSAALTQAPAGGGPTSLVPGQAFVVTVRVQNTAEAPAAGRGRSGSAHTCRCPPTAAMPRCWASPRSRRWRPPPRCRFRSRSRPCRPRWRPAPTISR